MSRLFYIIVSTFVMLFSSCGNYNKVLKSTDVEFKYNAAKEYYAKGEYITFRQLVSSSQSQMKNRRKTLVKLRLSFLLWVIFSLFFFPSAYVFSYYSQSKAVLAAEFMAD